MHIPLMLQAFDLSQGMDAANKMLTAGSSSFTYDIKGNMISETLSGTETDYTWDQLNRLIQWEKTGATTEYYVYNADGMRVRKMVGASQTDFLLDRNQIAEEIAGSSVISYVGRGLIAKINGEAAMIYHVDGLGSTRAMSDSGGLVATATVYDAYGNRLIDYPTQSTPHFGYAARARYFTDLTGLQYLKFRYYNPQIGRFISKDPIGYIGGLNLYAYVSNRPTSGVDPYGLYSWRYCLGACAWAILTGPGWLLCMHVCLGAGDVHECGKEFDKRMKDRKKCRDPKKESDCFDHCTNAADCSQCCEKKYPDKENGEEDNRKEPCQGKCENHDWQ